MLHMEFFIDNEICKKNYIRIILYVILGELHMK